MMYKYDEREPYYLELLTNFGLKPQEAKVYLTCLRIGQSTASQIAKEAGMQRTYCYDVLDDLKKRSLISSLDISGKKGFRAISIESLKFLLKEKFDRFEAFIPELKGLEKSTAEPNVRYFEGRDGIVAVMEDTLNQPPGSEILCYSNAEGFYSNDGRLQQWYVSERVKRKISMRFIAPDNPATMEYIKKDKQHKRETRAIPAEFFPFEAEMDIYGNKVAIISLSEGELIGLIIESEAIAKTFKMFFGLSWRGAKLTRL